jgi:biotin carboxylase
MKKLAIIGASYLQEPLIEKAKSMGIETHVFAWKADDIGERTADHFYPISIVEKENILKKCREIGIDGICSISSDLAVVAVNYVAEQMHLSGNPDSITLRCTNKHDMRACFEKNGDPSPKSILVEKASDLDGVELGYPVIVKPIDRSGSRGISKLDNDEHIEEAIKAARDQGFIKKALVEEYATGQEYSIECVSYNGQHHFLQMTHKYTTGAPKCIETGHLEPAPVSGETRENVRKVVFHALNSLGVRNGASHSELKIAKDGTIKIIEIGARMGGDFIGSDLVHISTGIDFVRAVIQIALGEKPDLEPDRKPMIAGVRFVFGQDDVDVFHKIKKEHPEYIVEYNIDDDLSGDVTDSSTRFGYYIMQAASMDDVVAYLPKTVNEIN